MARRSDGRAGRGGELAHRREHPVKEGRSGASLLPPFGLRYRQSLLTTPLESEQCRTTSRISRLLPFLAVSLPPSAPRPSPPRIRSTVLRTPPKSPADRR